MDFLTNFFQIALILILGYIGGELVSKVKLPRVLGYIIIGMFLGPYALGLLDAEIAQTALFNLLFAISVGFVGLSVGSGISFDEIKEGGTKILVIGLFASSGPFILVSLAMYYIFNFDIYTSLIFGSIALATAPVTALSLIKEFKVEGPVSRTLLLLAAIDDAIAIVLFGIIISLAGSYYGSGESSIIEPFIALAGSLIVGVVAGYIIYLSIEYIVKIGAQNKAVLLATTLLVLIMLVVADRLHTEALLVGITAGVVIYNRLEGKTKKLFDRATREIIPMSVLMVLILIGAMLDIHAIFSAFAIVGGAVYIIARSVGTIGGASIGARVVKAEKTVQKYLGTSMLAAAGVALTFAGIAIAVIPQEYAVKMGAIIAAAAVANEILAVFMTKWSFDKAGEIGKAKWASEKGS